MAKNSPMTKKDFQDSEKWREYGKLHVKHEGNVMAACGEHGDLHFTTVHHHRRTNQAFRDFLREVLSKAMDSAANVHKSRLANAITKGESIDSKLLKTADQFLRITKDIESKIEVNTAIHQGEALPMPMVVDIARWAAENPDKVAQLTSDPSRN